MATAHSKARHHPTPSALCFPPPDKHSRRHPRGPDDLAHASSRSLYEEGVVRPMFNRYLAEFLPGGQDHNLGGSDAISRRPGKADHVPGSECRDIVRSRVVDDHRKDLRTGRHLSGRATGGSLRKPLTEPRRRDPTSPVPATRQHFIRNSFGSTQKDLDRHGTLSLYAALDTRTGRVHGKTTARHTSLDFVSFLEEVVSFCPPRQQVHIILDDLSAHKTQLVRDFLQRHPPVRFHFTPCFLAQPGRDLVRQNRARDHCARYLHLGPRPGAQTSSLQQRLLCQRSPNPVEIL